MYRIATKSRTACFAVLGALAAGVFGASIPLVSCAQQEGEQPAGSTSTASEPAPAPGKVPVDKTLKDYLKSQDIKTLTMIKADTGVEIINPETGEPMKACAEVKEDKKIVPVAGPDGCDLTGKVTHIDTMTMFVVEGAQTKYCQYGTIIVPC